MLMKYSGGACLNARNLCWNTREILTSGFSFFSTIFSKENYVIYIPGVTSLCIIRSTATIKVGRLQAAIYSLLVLCQQTFKIGDTVFDSYAICIHLNFERDSGIVLSREEEKSCRFDINLSLVILH